MSSGVVLVFCMSLTAYFISSLPAHQSDLTQALYGSALTWKESDYGVWPPGFMLDQYIWWCKEVDPLLAHNPLWYETAQSSLTCLVPAHSCIDMHKWQQYLYWFALYDIV